MSSHTFGGKRIRSSGKRHMYSKTSFPTGAHAHTSTHRNSSLQVSRSHWYKSYKSLGTVSPQWSPSGLMLCLVAMCLITEDFLEVGCHVQYLIHTVSWRPRPKDAWPVWFWRPNELFQIAFRLTGSRAQFRLFASSEISSCNLPPLSVFVLCPSFCLDFVSASHFWLGSTPSSYN